MRNIAKWAMVASTMALVPPALADTADGEMLNTKTWDEVVEMARGGTVNWFLWGRLG